MSYPRHSVSGSYPSAKVQLVYPTVPADWAMDTKKIARKLKKKHNKIIKKISSVISNQTYMNLYLIYRWFRDIKNINEFDIFPKCLRTRKGLM